MMKFTKMLVAGVAAVAFTTLSLSGTAFAEDSQAPDSTETTEASGSGAPGSTDSASGGDAEAADAADSENATSGGTEESTDAAVDGGAVGSDGAGATDPGEQPADGGADGNTDADGDGNADGNRDADGTGEEDSGSANDDAADMDAAIGSEDAAGAEDADEDPDAGETEGDEPEIGAMVTDGDGTPFLLAQSTSAGWLEKRNGRVSGADRYATAAAVSKRAYKGAKTVVVATGADFPDALSAAAYAAKIKAPLLLTAPNALPAATRGEIVRLNKNTKITKVIVVGGTGAVSVAVRDQLLKAAPSAKFERISGVDRYATSAKIAAKWGGSATGSAFIATGADFPDALSAAAAAGKLGAPVILTPNTNATQFAGVRTALNKVLKKSSTVYIAGGTGVVSAGVATEVGKLSNVKTVKRYSGNNRYDTSAAITRGVFAKGWTDVYWATGTGFADALAGAAVAGAQGAPLLLVQPTCVPPAVYRANDRVTSGTTVLLGGTGALANTVRYGNECMNRPSGISDANMSGAQALYTQINQARYNAGLSAFRLADSVHGTPAYSWSVNMSSSKLKTNSGLSKQQAWAQYQTVAETGRSGNRASRLGSLLLSDKQARQWLMKPNGGVRSSLSVGYVNTNSKAYATVIVGSNLK